MQGLSNMLRKLLTIGVGSALAVGSLCTASARTYHHHRHYASRGYTRDRAYHNDGATGAAIAGAALGLLGAGIAGAASADGYGYGGYGPGPGYGYYGPGSRYYGPGFSYYGY